MSDEGGHEGGGDSPPPPAEGGAEAPNPNKVQPVAFIGLFIAALFGLGDHI